jgi:xanthine dehydrogenase accessory factor
LIEPAIFRSSKRGWKVVDEAEDILKTASRWLSEGRRICVATIIKREGSAPREVGAKMVVSSDGRSAGSIGGGGAEKAILDRMRQALADGRPDVVDLDLSGHSESLDSICGGRISVFIEPMGETRRLVIIGAGHVGLALAGLARECGFAVTLVDDRDEYLADPRLAHDLERVCAAPEDYGSLGIDRTSFVVICTRGHELDKAWLERVIGLNPRYLGMLGSKHKAQSILKVLEDKGVAREALEAVRTPVGIDIGALTPPEIAVSIVAELISEWRRGGREKT